MMRQFFRVILLSLFPLIAVAQDGTEFISMKYFNAVSKKADLLEANLDKETEKILDRFAKQEARVRKKLVKMDSSSAAKVFADWESGYKKFEEKLKNSTELAHYIPKVDTFLTSFKFLEQNQELIGEVKKGKELIDGTFAKVKGMHSQFQKAEAVKQFLKERKLYLKEQLTRFGFTKELKRMNEELFYYSKQLKEYKEILNDSRKIEKKAIELLSKTKAFQNFMQKNSILASMFTIPGNSNNGGATNLAGLQTRSQVNSLIQGQLSTGGTGAQQQFSQNLQEAQSQLRQLKEKVNQFGGENSEDIMPEGFRPNVIQSKRFLDRIEVGANIQTRKATNFFPIGSDFGLFMGYKLSGKSIIGVGASYKVSWGSGWNNIRITHEGIGLRSFIDWKLKGSIWISGGYEQNYLKEIRTFNQLKDLSIWQSSGLIGISKVVEVKSKVFKKTRIQLLWDFLANQQVPKAQPIVFRLGYNLK